MHCNLRSPTPPVLFCCNYDAHAKFEVAQGCELGNFQWKISGTDFCFTVDLLQLLTVLNANSKRFHLPQHTDLSSHRHQRL